MDQRAKIATSLLATLQDLCNQSSQTGQQMPPMPSEIFDRYVSLLKLTLQWLGFVGSDEDFQAIADKAGLGEYLRQIDEARAAKDAQASQSFGQQVRSA